MDYASHGGYEWSEPVTLEFLPSGSEILDGGNWALLPESGTMVGKKENANGKEYWTNEFSREGFAAYAEANQQLAYDPDDGRTYHPGSVPSQGYSNVEGWHTDVANFGQEPSHQEASASQGYQIEPPATPIMFDTGNNFAIQGFADQSLYDVGTFYQGGEPFPDGTKWTDGVSSWKQQEPSAEDGPGEEPPSSETKQGPPQIPYCDLLSHAKWLVSKDGPVTMGVRGNEVEVAENKLKEEPNMYAEPRLLINYGKWAAKQAKVDYKAICQKCFVKYLKYFFKGGKYEGTCYCNPDPTAV
jgi:hypothetical protein